MNDGRKRADLRYALEQCVNAAAVQKLGEMLLQKAYAGDVKAARIVLEFVLGKPTQEITISGPIKLYDIGKDVEEAV